MRQKFSKLWARADKGHLTAKDVDELRKLIDARPSQKSAKASQPFTVGKKLARLVALIRHRSEFQYHKFPSVNPPARLAEYHGRAELYSYQNRCKQIYGQKQKEENTREDHVKHPLDVSFVYLPLFSCFHFNLIFL
jgi:hypothetical protein